MLEDRDRRLRSWAPFLLVALLPSIAIAIIGARAVTSEEAAVRRETALATQGAASDLASRIEAEIAADGAKLASENATPAFADAFDDDGETVTPLLQKRTTAACSDLVTKLPRSAGAEKSDVENRLIRDCPDARSEGGRFVVPLIVLTRKEPFPADFSTYLRDHAAAMTSAERAAAAALIEAREGLPSAERAALLADLRSGGARSLGSLLSDPAIADARKTARASERPTAIRTNESVGYLIARGDHGMRGFLVHRGSLERAFELHAVPIADGLAVRVASGPSTSPDDLRAERVLAPSLVLAIFPADEALPARRARRSRFFLAIVIALTAASAFAIAAVQFARARAARRTSALRTDFVAAVSHELRTPVASVRMLAELLRDGHVPEDERAEVEATLATEAARLGDTVDRMLRLRRALAEREDADLKVGDLSEPIGASIAAFRARFPDVRLEVDVAAITCEIDAPQLRLAIDNLLANARKYAPDGEPYAVSAKALGKTIRIAVEDHGPGVARADRARIFEPFERADDRLSEATEGTGIGLALVRHVARSHGGDATVETPNDGKGARFVITFPKHNGKRNARTA